jgi:hypothetical protein
VSLRDFLWSKFWTGFVPVVVLTEALTIAANEFLGIDLFLKVLAAVAIVFMSLALVGLAAGLGARYPRFGADPSQVAGSFGGVAFMTQAVLLVLVMLILLGWPSATYLSHRTRGVPLSGFQHVAMIACFVAAGVLSLTVWQMSMRSGIRALEKMSG